MKTRILLVSLAILALSFSSCQKDIEAWKKKFQTTDRNYTIKQYSGGVLIGTYTFRGTLNDSEGSDGYYFYDGNALIEISGDIIITSTK